jgi:tetratricopeptide (TPR) repeat protein
MTTVSDLLTIFDSNLYSEFLEKYPEVVTPELETDNLITARGISFLRTGQPSEAVKNFQILIQKNPNNKESRLYHTCQTPLPSPPFLFVSNSIVAAGNVWMQDCLEKGNELLTNGKMQEAYEAYSQIKLNDYENLNKNLVFQLSNNLAVCLLNLGRAAEALDAFNSSHLTSSLEDDTSSLSEKRKADTALNKAIILKSLQRYEEALTEFDQCLVLQTENLNAICGKAEILSSLGRFDEAVEMTTAAIEAHPIEDKMATATELPKVTQILSLWVARGFASIKLSQFPNAMNDFNFVIQLASQPPYASLIPSSETSLSEAYRLRNICLSYYGDHLLSAGEILKAIEIYDEAITIAGGEDMVPTVSVLFNRAYGFYQLSPSSAEYLDKAIEGFQAVVKRDPSHFQGQTGLGQALLNKADAMVAKEGTVPLFPSLLPLGPLPLLLLSCSPLL